MASTLGRPRGARGMLQDKTGWQILDESTVRRRVWICSGFLVLAFFGLLVRLWFLQILHGDEYLQAARHNQVRDVPLAAPRGLILDRNGKVLATSRASHSVAIVPAALPSAKRAPDERARILNTLGNLLKIAPADIETLLSEARKKGGHDYDPVRILESVDLATITLIEENKVRLGHDGNTAVLVTDDIKRYYPNATVAAHVLGYTGVVDARDLKRMDDRLEKMREAGEDDPLYRDLRFDDIIGKNGLEREYDTLLAGTGGSQQYEVDSQLRPVRYLGEVAEAPGHTLRLTLDLKLQKAAEVALANARNNGAVVAIDPRNGAVRVMASKPTFDPNIWSLPRDQFNQRYRATEARPGNPFLPRAVASAYPPGSTFKLITAVAGLEHGWNPQTVTQCSGGYRLNGRKWFGCWNTHGAKNLYGAIEDSCNVHFYQMSLAMGNAESTGPTYLAEVARRFGLDSKTGIDLPIDEDGIIPDPAWRRRLNPKNPDLAHWYPGNTLNMSIGQGDVLATPLQMALAVGAIANGGRLWRPHLLEAVLDDNGRVLKKAEPHSKSVNVEDRYLAIIRRGMRRVMTDGTGQTAALSYLAVAGKTGSAEDVHNVLPHAWFVAYAPYAETGGSAPQLVIAAVVENSGHGSENAAPIAKAILEAAFPAPAKKADEP